MCQGIGFRAYYFCSVLLAYYLCRYQKSHSVAQGTYPDLREDPERAEADLTILCAAPHRRA